MRYKTVALFGLLLLTLTTILAACSDATPTPTTSALATLPNNSQYPVPINPQVAKEPPFTLKVLLAEDYYNQPPLVDLVKEFQQAYPNIKIAVDHTDWGNIPDKVKSSINFGQPPDVAHQHAFALGAQGYAEPVDDLWQQWGASSQFLPAALEDVTWNGKKYGVPLDINCTFLIYNKALFDAAKLPYPTNSYTYTQLMADAKKLTDASKEQFGVAFNNGVWNMFGHLVSNGGELLTNANNKLTAQINSPANVQMMQLIYSAINVDKVAPRLPISLNGADPVNLFEQGKLAMFFSGPWDLQDIQQKAPDIYSQLGTATMPRGMDGQAMGSVQGGGSLFVPKGSQHREAAFEFMKWAASSEYQLRLAKEMSRYPVISSVYQNAFFTDQTLLQPFFQQLQTAHSYTLQAYPEAELSWEQAIYSIMSGSNSDIAATLQQANQQMQLALSSASGKT